MCTTVSLHVHTGGGYVMPSDRGRDWRMRLCGLKLFSSSGVLNLQSISERSGTHEEMNYGNVSGQSGWKQTSLLLVMSKLHRKILRFRLSVLAGAVRPPDQDDWSVMWLFTVVGLASSLKPQHSQISATALKCSSFLKTVRSYLCDTNNIKKLTLDSSLIIILLFLSKDCWKYNKIFSSDIWQGRPKKEITPSFPPARPRNGNNSNN